MSVLVTVAPPQVAITRVWADLVSRGVAVGTHCATPPRIASGCPADVTRTVPTDQMALTHGPLATVGGGRVHADTTYGTDSSAVGWPETVTRGLGAAGVAGPWWAQLTSAPRCRSGPGITSPSMRRC